MAEDQIERQVHIDAPIDRVWTLMTQAEHLGRWFGDAGAEIDLRPGGAMSLTWEEYGTVECKVEAVEPPHRFAYRWQSQLVEFTLTSEDDGTRVRVIESGFDTIPDAEKRAAQYAGNTEGWKAELGDLAEYAAKVPAQR